MKLNLLKSKLFLSICAAGMCIGIAGFTFLVTEHHIFPYPIVKAAEKKAIAQVKRILGKSKSEANNGGSIEDRSSILLRLQLKSFAVDMPGVSRGGGMTSFKDELIFINQVGEVFLVENDKITKSDLQTPNNGIQDYAALSEDPAFNEYEINSVVIRYNDIQYYNNGQNSGLLISYTEWRNEQKCYGSTIAELPLTADTQSILDLQAKENDWRIIYRTKPCLPLKTMVTAIEGHMAGGRIAFEPPSTVYLASGDYHWDGVYAPKVLAQSWENDYGKVLSINMNTGKATRISRGHRNMQGILFDDSNQLWVVEHGARGGDELNKIKEGANYGWPVQTLGTRYNYLQWPNTINYGRHDLPEFEAPLFSFVPSIGVSNITQIKGFDPSWNDDFLLGSLSGKALFRLRLRPDRVLFAEKIPIGKRIRYVHQHSDGRIVAWTDEMQFVFITKAKADNSYSFIEKILRKKISDQKLRKEVHNAVDRCMECHTFNTTDIAAGPPLGNIFGRDIASTKFPAYSSALKSVSGKWTEDSLFNYLNAPEKFAEGTSMPNPNIKSADVTKELIKIMRQLATDLEQGK